MPLTRIKNTAIGDDGVTTQKLDDTTGGFTHGTHSLLEFQ